MSFKTQWKKIFPWVEKYYLYSVLVLFGFILIYSLSMLYFGYSLPFFLIKIAAWFALILLLPTLFFAITRLKSAYTARGYFAFIFISGMIIILEFGFDRSFYPIDVFILLVVGAVTVGYTVKTLRKL